MVQVIELRALRALAADLYSFNTLSIEAQEVASKMASLREQQSELLPPGETLQADGALDTGCSASTSLVTSGLDEEPQQGQSLVSAFTESQLFEPDLAQQPQAGSSSPPPQELEVEDRSASSSGAENLTASESRAEDSDEAGDEVAEMANALWEGAEADMEAGSQTDTEQARHLDGAPVTEQQPLESIGTESNRAFDRLDRLQHEPEGSDPPASASTRPSEYGNGADVADNNGLQMPLLGKEKDELREMQEEMQIEIHSGKLHARPLPHYLHFVKHLSACIHVSDSYKLAPINPWSNLNGQICMGLVMYLAKACFTM